VTLGVLVTETTKETDSGRSGVELNTGRTSQIENQERVGKDGLLE